MERLVGMAAAARARGEHYDTYRKRWPSYVRDPADGWPAPVKDSRPYKWRPSAIEAWQVRRQEASYAAVIRAATDPVVPANDARAAPPPRPRRLAAARDEVRNLMRTA